MAQTKNTFRQARQHSLAPVMKSGWIFLAMLCVSLTSCLEQRFELGENMPIAGQLNPAFALPLGSGEWSVQDALNQLDSLEWISDPQGGTVTLVQPFELFEAPPLDLPFIDESLSEELQIDAETAQALSNLPPGSLIELDYETAWNWELSNMDTVDSLWVSEGMLSVSLVSDIPMNHSIQLVCANLIGNDGPIAFQFDLPYSGSTPLTQTVAVSTADARGLFSATDGVEVLFDWTVSLESTGATVDDDVSISVQVDWDNVLVSGAFGKFSSQTSVDFDVVQALPLLTEWNPEQLHIADPRIRLTALNSSGIPVGIEWDEFSFSTDYESWSVSGSDIDEFPVFSAAPFLGAWAETEHVIDNTGTSPTLTETLELRPDSATISGQLLLNPDGENSNFLVAESQLLVEGALEIPLTGWAQGLTWRDTIAGAISQELNAGINPPLDWQDVESVTIRFIATNGWPLGMAMQVRFLDGNDIALDSLYAAGEQDSFQIAAGQVDGSLSPANVEFGRVMQPQQEIMDLVLERDQARDLLTMDCQGIEIILVSNTFEAGEGGVVRFFPEDLLRMQVSARLDFEISMDPG